jgi:pimeloyl-ACP methyl ester carboxylesterase
MKPEYIHYKTYTLCQYTRLEHKAKLLVFLPGLGDSYLNYEIFFNLPALNEFDIVVLEPLGHGKTGAATSYTYANICDCYHHQLSKIIKCYKHVALLPHSVAGITATQLCESDLAPYISRIVALESSITQYGSFVTENLANCMQTGENFKTWFEKFKASVYQQGQTQPIL